MGDPAVDLLVLNRELLRNPGAAGSNELVALLELEKPGLEFLCPLAKAIYLLETERPQRADPREALNSCHLVDDTFSGSCLELSDDSAGIEEQVSHELKRHFGQKEISLGFASTGGMLFCQSFWDDYLRSVEGTNLPFGLLDEPVRFINEAFGMLDSQADASPGAYPSDKDEFTGALSYSLVNINGISIDGPTLENSKTESSWQNLSEKYRQRYPESSWNDHEGQLCWLHYLNAEQAALLGIGASGKDAIDEKPDYPAWVPKDISEQGLEATWISPDDLQDSYSSGRLSIPESVEAWFALGCGADWRPGADLNEEDDSDDETEDSLVFDPMARPLITAHITRSEKTLPEEILNLKPYLIRLTQMLGRQEG